MSRLDDFWSFVNERHATYIRKSIRDGESYLHVPEGYDARCFDWAARGTAGYVTRDPIISQYRFCNVFRELDRVTKWIRYNIRRRYADHEHLWFMLAIARTINWPDTLQRLIDVSDDPEDCPAWPSRPDFDPGHLAAALDERKEKGLKVYTGAYMIRAESDRSKPWYSWSKQRYIAEVVLGRLWRDRDDWVGLLDRRARNGGDLPTLRETWERFQEPRYVGWGPFMAYQVVVDLRHTRYLSAAPDVNSWAALGPGSRRGLNRLWGRDPDFPLNQDAGLDEMVQLYADQDARRAPWVPRIDLSDIQNCLCEFDKYERVRLNQGRPRALYVPGRGY